jgi:LytS/YehU family sensor histidine kinase
MLHDLWALITDPVFISLTFFILWILSIQKKRRVEYLLGGRLANEHTINNMLVNSISIADPKKQSDYLRFVAKFVKYGFNCQDKPSIPLSEELELVNELIKAQEISNDSKIDTIINVDSKFLSLPIIPFSLLTVVENAINYGELNEQQKQLKLTLRDISDNLYSIDFTGYSLPDKSKINKPIKGHGLYILKERLRFWHFDKNSQGVKGNKYVFISSDGLTLTMILPK